MATGRPKSWMAVAVITSTLTAIGVPAAAQAASNAAAATSNAERSPMGDFNDDGYRDLAVGVPREDVNGDDNAGAVQVIYGTADGLNGDHPIDDQFWTQDSGGVPGITEPGDQFGQALAWGDFDLDGFSDLAIGVPFEDLATSSSPNKDAGVVHVLYGSVAGLTGARNVLFSQNSSGVEGRVSPGDRFGEALGARNFGKGGASDLAIGVPYEDIDDVDQGAVNVLYGTSGTGLTSTGDQVWHADVMDVEGASHPNEHFGAALTGGDFGRSAEADLAIGVPDDRAIHPGGGAVNVLYGSPSGLTVSQDQLWYQDGTLIHDRVEDNDHFGATLAAGDLGNGFRQDLAIGVPDEDSLSSEWFDAGQVQVLYGSAAGLTASGDQVWSFGTTGVAEGPDREDHLGSALAIGNFGKSGHGDLAIGVPYRDIESDNNPTDEGAVLIIYGSASGLTATGSRSFSQNSSSIEGDSEEDDHFGSTLAAADFGKTLQADLAIGVPIESYENAPNPFGDVSFIGAVNVIYGSSTGLTAAGDQFWWQRSDTLHDSGETNDQFGLALA